MIKILGQILKKLEKNILRFYRFAKNIGGWTKRLVRQKNLRGNGFLLGKLVAIVSINWGWERCKEGCRVVQDCG